MNAEERAARWLMAWDSQGTHRTGTAGDHAGAAWLAAEAREAGVTPVIEPFLFHRLDPTETFLEVEGHRIAGVPVFDAPTTDGVSGRMGLPGSGAAIVLAELSPRAVYTQDWRSLRRDPGPRAVVVLCQGEYPGLGLLNAEQFNAPYGAPAIHIPTEAGELVRAAADRGTIARVVARADRIATDARNVVVSLPGTDATSPPVVVMTPRSSWWQSTSERGGGLVCWLETLRALLAHPPNRRVIMTANTGHEIGHLGLDAFLERRRGWDQPGGACWVHYGANLGAVGGRLSVMSASDDLRAAMQAALAQAGQPPDEMGPPSVTPSGETRDIHLAGGRYVTLVGTNPLFHLPQDRWPDAVDVPAIARLAAGAAAMVVGLTR